uniref:Uncharacterized protein n=1 Tax=Oryza barthii TaxID=65489 RepID=A0A0D3HUF4_9ORYZ
MKLASDNTKPSMCNVSQIARPCMSSRGDPTEAVSRQYNMEDEIVLESRSLSCCFNRQDQPMREV